MQPIYKGQRLNINDEKGHVRLIIESEEGNYFWIVFKRDKGSTEIYQMTLDKYKIKEK